MLRCSCQISRVTVDLLLKRREEIFKRCQGSEGPWPGRTNQFQFVADHGSGCSGVLISTRNTSTSRPYHHWQPQAVEPCMCETSLTCSGSFAKLQGVTRSFKIAQRDASKLQRVFQALQIINIGQKGPSPQATAPAQPSTCP